MQWAIALGVIAIVLVVGLQLMFWLVAQSIHRNALADRAARSANTPVRAALEREAGSWMLHIEPLGPALELVELDWPAAMAQGARLSAPAGFSGETPAPDLDDQAEQPWRIVWTGRLPIAARTSIAIPSQRPDAGAGSLLLWFLVNGVRRPLWVDLAVHWETKKTFSDQ